MFFNWILMLNRKVMWYFVLMIMSFILFFWWSVFAENDLLYDTMSPSQDLIIYPSKSSKRVWNRFFRWSDELSVGGDGWDSKKKPNLFAKVTRLLLILVITLSVTMILYNWIMYIVKIWQGEDSKNLMKNVMYIVVWILISLFSVVIITLLRSVPKTLEDIDQKNGDAIYKEVILGESKD